MSMLCQVAMPPFELYIDCKGTVSMLWAGPGSGTGVGDPRAHMWSRVWASLGPADFSAHKTRAHCSMQDVHNERTTLWEKKGNDAADEFAKRGASITGP